MAMIATSAFGMDLAKVNSIYWGELHDNKNPIISDGVYSFYFLEQVNIWNIQVAL